MAFSEQLKKQIRRRAWFRCCLCQELGVEVHHIIPQADAGDDRPANAAPLCPTCHDRYGANREKRKFIRESRDHWYEVCDRRRSLKEEIGSFARTLVADAVSNRSTSRHALSLGEVLDHLHELAATNETDADVLYELAFEGREFPDPLHLPQRARDMLNALHECLGEAVIRMLCGYIVATQNFRPTRGSTGEDVEDAHAALIAVAVIVSLHSTICRDEQPTWDLFIGIDRRLFAQLKDTAPTAPDTPSPPD